MPIKRPVLRRPEPENGLLATTLLGETKNSSLSPDEKFRPIRVKVSLNEVQVNLQGKQVI